MGTKCTYKVQKQQAYSARFGGGTQWKTVGTSSYLSAFNPYASAISCGL